jgi:hypothetical protein
MTFFANAGISWPNVEAQLREAGTQALDAGAHFWGFIAAMERWSPDGHEDFEVAEHLRDICIGKLLRAADIYSNNLKSIGDIQVRQLDQAEIELVDGLRPPSDRFRIVGRSFNMRQLYEVLIQRIRELAQQLAHLEVRRRKEITPLVFQNMQQWERIAMLARLIAVLNLRPNAGSDGPSSAWRSR